MSSRLTKENSDFNAQSPKRDDGESVDDMLANLDQFIEGIYRDLSLCPPQRPALGNIVSSDRPLNTSDTTGLPFTTSPASPGSLPITSSGRAETPVRSPAVRRNMEAEIDRINSICDNVDQNLRSIGIFMNNLSSSSRTESPSNTNSTNSPSSSTSLIIVNNTSPSRPPVIRRANHQKKASVETTNESVIDLSNSQAESPKIFRRPHNGDSDDDDVILVSANIPHVVDLCTPGNRQEIDRPKHNPDLNLNRRRLYRNSFGNDADSSCEGPSSSRKRRTVPSGNFCQLVNEIVSEKNSEIPAPLMCPVCMDSCLNRQPTSTICGHIFCKRCIKRAVALKHKCPMCNKKVTGKEIFRIYL